MMSLSKTYTSNHSDKLGILASLACAVHCTILPMFLSSLSLFGIDFLDHPVIEWLFIGSALWLGVVSLWHAFKHHHQRKLPIVLFILGFIALILNQIYAEKWVLILIPCASLFMISAHVMNLHYTACSRNSCK